MDNSKISIVADNTPVERPSRQDAEAAVRTILSYIGEDPKREGLLDTPARVVRAYDDFFAGYDQDPEEYLKRTFEETGSYDDLVFMRDISFQSHCEHHMVPIIGKAHIAYLPNGRVVGLSKLARVIDAYAKRLQIQETMTAQIVDTIERVLKPRGVALMINAEHHCMSCRGVQKAGTETTTLKLSGMFQTEDRWEQRFMTLVHSKN